MKIFINGKQKEFPSNTTIEDIIHSLNAIPETFVVELNQSIIQPEAYKKSCLVEGDTLELIRFVGGG